MSDAANGGGEAEAPALSEFLVPERVLLDLETSSRKRLFEHIAELSSHGLEEVSEGCILKKITERERLGSTGLGRGIAVPHGRIENLEEPVISVVKLSNPIDYDAPDEQPVWLAVGLLVPIEANEAHLKLLSLLVTRFQDESFIDSMKQCHSREQVVALFDGREAGA